MCDQIVYKFEAEHKVDSMVEKFGITHCIIVHARKTFKIKAVYTLTN